MKKIKLTILLMTLLCSCAFAQVKVYVRLQQEIYAGEQFRMEVVAENSQSAAEINPTELKDFNASFMGNSLSSSSSRIIINGRVIEDKSEYVSSWNLMVEKAGQYTIPSLTATVDNTKYQTEPVSFSVISPETSDLVGLEAKVSTTSCYIGQPIAFSVNWHLAANPASFDFNIPAIMNEDLFSSGNLSPDGNDKPQKIEGTSIGDIIITQRAGKYKDNPSTLVNFNKYIIPRKSGQISIDPISVTCKIDTATRRRSSFFDDPFRQRQYKRYQASAEPITLNVKPLPTDNKPSDYYGLVGRSYFISTELVNAPEDISVGTPLTLKINISGNGGLLNDVTMPDLSFMASDFKIPADHASGEVVKDTLVFTQTIRPLRSSNDGLIAIPEITIPFFNYTTGKYDRASSQPITINVSGARKIIEADVASNISATPTANASELNKTEHKIAANHYGTELLTNTAFSATELICSTAGIIAVAGPAVMVIICLLLVTSTKSPEKIKNQLAAKASAKAITNINKISIDDQSQFITAIVDIMREYIADKFALTAQSLTAQDCFNTLSENKVNSDLAQSFRNILELGEASRYAGSSGVGHMPNAKDIVELIKAIEKEIRK